ncbi:sulfite exporter TauE/SafE family protein [Aestuariibacter halophilus]|uniref:Probable membrane transporter protein n=1 Tax=Fluctibacter halophilus TaxID=226011 RepID=A0ABS8G6G0_9ALTE|nr:sulfite exporter TauE/SafE family protein [Aestuariibacter halophilus]MCC2616182.1 sulfite exporter TauE/SafE family protein [Aestuariibacter halophilus]
MSWEWILFGVFIWFSFSTEVATGFGSIIIALALGALFLPIGDMLPVLVTLNSVMNLVILSKLYRDIHQPTLLKRILPLMLGGMAIGIVAVPYLPEREMKIGFALLVLWFAGRSLWQSYRPSSPSTAKRGSTGWIGLAGVTHGLYASGGPLLVLGLASTTLDKARFRATLLATWCTLNLCYTAYFAINGQLLDHASHIVAMLPVLGLAALCGHWLHHRVNEQQFKTLVFWVLLMCGAIMLFNAAR